MQCEIIHLPKQKTWGVVDHPFFPGHFYTGYDRMWEHTDGVNYAAWHDLHHVQQDRPDQHMEAGRNVIITGDLAIDSMSRGRSAANFKGHFYGHSKVPYEFGMSGILDLLKLIQDGAIYPVKGYLSGRWTFAKQGSNMFLKPYSGA